MSEYTDQLNKLYVQKPAHEAKNSEGMTYKEWLRAALPIWAEEDDRCRKAWRHGEDPTEHKAFLEREHERVAREQRTSAG